MLEIVSMSNGGISSWLEPIIQLQRIYFPKVSHQEYLRVSADFWYAVTQLSSFVGIFFSFFEWGIQLTKIFSAFDEGLDSPPLVEDAVTVVATLNGLIVWCTFKNFLSVTFMMLVFVYNIYNNVLIIYTEVGWHKCSGGGGSSGGRRNYWVRVTQLENSVQNW